MKISTQAVAAIKGLWTAHQDLARGSDDDRRALTRLMAEQLATQDPKWGTKSADPGRPPSKDAVAYNGASLWGWDTINGTSREVQVAAGQEGEDITGQTFIAVTPTDHLGTGQLPIPPIPPIPPTQPPVDLGPLNQAMLAIAQAVQISDDNNERRYLDLVAHFKALGSSSTPVPVPPAQTPGPDVLADILAIVAALLKNRKAA